MAATMAEREVQHCARAMALDVEDRIGAGRICGLDEAGAGTGAFGVEQDVQVAMGFEMIELVGGLERLDTAGELMVRIDDAYRIGLDRRVRDELRTQQVHHQRGPAGCFPQAGVE